MTVRWWFDFLTEWENAMKKMVIALALVAALAVGAVAGEPNPANADRILVFVPKATNSQFWIAIWDGAKQAAKELGYKEVKFQGAASAGDVLGQINILNDVATSRPSGILIAVNDQMALKNPVEDAIDAGVPVVTVNSGVQSEKVSAHAGTDNYNAGAMGAHTLAKLIGEKGLVMNIGIDASSETGRQRESGFRETMEKHYPEVKLLPTQHSLGDVNRAMNITSDQLTGNPDVVGIFCAQDNGGTGAAQALKQRGVKDKIKLVAFDSSPDEFLLFLDGYLDALVVQDPFMQGYQGVYAIDPVINGGQPEKKYFETMAKVVTMDNISEPEYYDVMARNPTIKDMMTKRGITSK